MSDMVRTQRPNFTCINIGSYEQFIKSGLNGCGTKLAYPLLISYIFISKFLIMNLIISSILFSYEAQFTAEQSAINIYQLKKIKKVWMKFDPKAKLFISYPQITSFLEQISSHFGLKIEDETVFDDKLQKYIFKIIEIPLYYNASGIYCYNFYEILSSFCKFPIFINYAGVNE